jgi:rhamnose transport system substrate-binding protein
MISGEFVVKEGAVFDVGRMGEIVVGKDNEAVMSEPYQFNADNIDKFAAIY